ncbi:MAG: hypothetical protein AAF996_13980 [Pseudomonadota bacterium]
MFRARLFRCSFVIAAGLSLAPLTAADPYETFSGIAVCDGERIGLTLNLTRAHGLDPTEFNDPCRSGSGPCNDMYRRRFEATRIATGEAYISRLSSDGTFEATQYALNGTAVDIPPKGWNRQLPMHYEYRFESADSPGSAEKISLELLRYTDIYDDEEMTSLKINNKICEQTDMVHRRVYAVDLLE